MPTRENGDGVLERISESFRPFVEELFKDMNFGLCRSKLEIDGSGGQPPTADRFTLVLPYGGGRLRWEVLFDASRPWFAPDFRFDDETFLAAADADFVEERVPSLAQWDDADPKALCRVVAELMKVYGEHQRQLLNCERFSRPHFEYTTLIGNSDRFGNDVEILVGKGNSVNFMIKLNIDGSKLPAVFKAHENEEDGIGIDENPGGESAVLLVKYPNPAKVELIMSPLVSRAVCPISLPPIQDTALLMDYVPEITEIINRKIKRILENEKLKTETLARFIAKYECCVLQHGLDNAAFLFEVDDFYTILQIDLASNFPERPPQIVIRSVYHAQKGKQCFKVLSDCPQTNIEQYIKDEIVNFRNTLKSANMI